MQDDNAMNGTQSEISKLKADLAKLEKDREFWHEEAGRLLAILNNGKANTPSPGAKLYGRAEARFQVSADLLAYARRAWESGDKIDPSEIRDIALQFRKTAEADREQGRELDRIASESAE